MANLAEEHLPHRREGDEPRKEEEDKEGMRAMGTGGSEIAAAGLGRAEWCWRVGEERESKELGTCREALMVAIDALQW